MIFSDKPIANKREELKIPYAVLITFKDRSELLVEDLSKITVEYNSCGFGTVCVDGEQLGSVDTMQWFFPQPSKKLLYEQVGIIYSLLGDGQ